MLINLRNALIAGKRLPYDAELEYLESTGTQWIDTGVYGAQNIRTKIDYQLCYSGSVPQGKGLFGCYTNGMKYHLFCSNGSGQFQVGMGNSYINTVAVDTNRHDIDYHDGSVAIDGVTVASFDAYSGATSYTMTLFALRNGSGTLYAQTQMRVYSVKMWDNGVLVRDYIPVRKGTVGYLYDRVSGKLFGNAGTGDFVLGPDVVPVEWIQTDGAAYIDTGLEMADGHEVRAEHYFKRSTTRQLMGSNASRQYYGVSADGYVEFGLLGTNKSTVSVDESKKYLISYAASAGNNTGAVYDGDTLLWSSSGAYFGFSNSFKIFLLSTNTGLPFVAGNKIASFKHIASGETIQSLLPVRVGTDATSWEGAMLDTLTRRIYRNAGTGAFGYGNDLKYPIPSE